MPEDKPTPKVLPLDPDPVTVARIALSIENYYANEMDLRHGGPAAYQLSGTAGEPGSVRIIARNRRDPYNDLGKPDGPWGVALRALVHPGSGSLKVVPGDGGESLRLARGQEAVHWMRYFQFRGPVTVAGWSAAIGALIDWYNREVADVDVPADPQ